MGLPDAATLTERKVRARKTFHALSASCLFDESKIFPPIQIFDEITSKIDEINSQRSCEKIYNKG